MEQKTFFNWFTDHGDPSADDIAEVMWQSYEISNFSAVLDRDTFDMQWNLYSLFPYVLFPHVYHSFLPVLKNPPFKQCVINLDVLFLAVPTIFWEWSPPPKKKHK